MSRSPYPFSALVGQADLALALLLNAVSPAVGGVLVRGEKGTAKSTAVRGLSRLLPEVQVVDGCPFNCDPWTPDPDCPAGPHRHGAPRRRRPAPLVELPVGASTDRVAGSLDLERALTEGRRGFEPGLLAAAHRGVLYVDEANLLGDHLVDLLLDAAALGVNYVEREGVSVRHAARFLLVGTMNPEEGELRPQLLDRFGVTVEVRGNADPAERVEVIRRRLAYEADPDGFAAAWAAADAALTERIVAARRRLPGIRLDDELLQRIAAVCAAFAVDGLRGDIVTAKAALALAAWEGRDAVTLADVRRAALLALPHRRRRGPMDAPGLDEDELDRILSSEPDRPGPGRGSSPGASGDGPSSEGDGALQPAGAPAGPGGSAADARGAPELSTAWPTAAGGTGAAGAGAGGLGGAGSGGDGDDAGGAGGRGSSAGPGADGRHRDRPAAGGAGTGSQTVALPGETFTPIRLELAGTGAGAWGRRSRAETAQGHPVSDRADRRDGATLALAATLRSAAVATLRSAAVATLPTVATSSSVSSASGLGAGPAPGAVRDQGASRVPGAGGPGAVWDPRAGATVSVPAAAAGPASGGRVRVRAGDLRWQVREGREGNLVLFVVDASGSMAARQRMTATKGAVLSLLLDAYQRRDKVGLVSFRGSGATVLLPPTSSVELAARRLTALPTGGRTPLDAGLARARTVLAAEAVRDPRRRPLLVVITDGRANAVAQPIASRAASAAGEGSASHAGSASGEGSAARPGWGPASRLGLGADPVTAAMAEARALADAGVAAVVVDTEAAVVRLGLAAELALALNGPCIALEALAAQPLAGLVRAVAGTTARPGPGSVARPGSGTAARVGSGGADRSRRRRVA
jgi:magnesium chelatase subunit D